MNYNKLTLLRHLTPTSISTIDNHQNENLKILGVFISYI